MSVRVIVWVEISVGVHIRVGVRDSEGVKIGNLKHINEGGTSCK